MFYLPVSMGDPALVVPANKTPLWKSCPKKEECFADHTMSVAVIALAGVGRIS